MRPVSVLGLGLMGGSVVRSLSEKGWSVRCWSPDAEERTAADGLDHVSAVESLGDLARDCAGIIVATPLAAVRGLLARLGNSELPRKLFNGLLRASVVIVFLVLR